MKKLLSYILSLILLALLCSSIFTHIYNFFLWLFMLDYNSPNISFVGGLVVRILTFIVSYGLVGILFNLLGYYNSKWMSFMYLIISSLLGFLFSYLIWILETYIIYISIIFGIILFGIIIYFGVLYFNRKEV